MRTTCNKMLADLLMDGDDKQFVLYPKFEAQGERAAALLSGEIDKHSPTRPRRMTRRRWRSGRPTLPSPC